MWQWYSKKMGEKIENPRSLGRFTKEDATARQMRCVSGEKRQEERVVKLYWLVDESDGMIVDAKFQTFGCSALIAAAEGCCELVVGKSYDQASRISAELIDKQLRDKPNKPAFPQESASSLNLVLEAMDEATQQCSDIPLAQAPTSPLPTEPSEVEENGKWLTLSHEQKLASIEKILDEEIRPYIELDEGGVEIKELIDDKELIISYQGACTSCFSAVGTTLSTIQHILQAKVHSDLVVIPHSESLKF